MKIKLRRPEERDLVTVVNFELELARARGNFTKYSDAAMDFLKANVRRFEGIVKRSWKFGYNIVLAEVAGGVVGYIMYDTVSRENTTFVGSLYVNSNFRKMGVGRKLLDYLRKESESKGLKSIALYTPIKESKEFYKRLGFKKSGNNGFVLDLN